MDGGCDAPRKCSEKCLKIPKVQNNGPFKISLKGTRMHSPFC